MWENVSHMKLLKQSIIPAVSCCLFFSLCGVAQSVSSRTAEERQSYREAMEQADLKIAAEVKNHSELMKNLEYLTTEIGPRLTGSPQMQTASQWTLQRFQAYGLDAHLETARIAHAWTRGRESAHIVSPIQRRLTVHAFGWSKATPGPVTASVVEYDPSTDNSGQNDQALDGAIVLMGKPHIQRHPELADNAYDAVIPPRKGVSDQAQPHRRGALAALMRHHPAVLLLDAGKPFDLFTMGSISDYRATRVPIAFLDHADYSLLSRLQQDGKPVTLTIDLENTFSPGPVPASITVAQIKGSEHPEEQVIIGGHLDSWDLGQGAVDNGTGAMAVLEAARALKALGWRPRRTITFILFTGEEQGGIGAETFLKNHRSEIGKMDAVLVDDTGTGKVTSIALENLWFTGPLLSEIYRPLEEVFDLDPISTRYFGSSDHVDFLRAGVPAYFCVQKPADYGFAHHSQDDTLDEVIPDQVNEGAALLAAWAWNVSEMPQPLPHHTPDDTLE